MRTLDPWALELRGTRLIEASAGTGKTHTLTTLYLRLLVEEGLLPSQILVVTYTQAATAELRERIRARIREALAAREAAAEDPGACDPELARLFERGEARRRALGGGDPLRLALQGFDEAAIFTIHGFCQRTLRDHGFECGMPLDIELVEGADALDEALARDLWARLLGEEDDDFVTWLIDGPGQRRWSFEPDALKRKLIDLLGADEEMPVLPEPESAAPPDRETEQRLVEALDGAWRRCLAHFAEGREELEEWLVNGGALKRNSYKKATIEARWLPLLDEWLRRVEQDGDAAVVDPAERPDWLEKLTPEGLDAGVKKGETRLHHAFFDACRELDDAFEARVAALHARALDLRRRFVEAARTAARARREERHLLFFDDLLSELRDALHATRGDQLVELLRDRFPFALIDEFQDTDPVQYDIFRRVWHRARLEGSARGMVLIGDPKQAIYSFRGADVYTYLAARADAEGEAASLEVNYRSDPSLITALNALFSGVPDVFRVEEIVFEAVRPRTGPGVGLVAPGRSEAGLRVLLADRAAFDDGSEPDADKGATRPIASRVGRLRVLQAVAKDVADLLDAGATIEGRSIRPSDIAVLCRRKSELARVRRALEERGIPCVDQGHDDVFDSEEAGELLCVLRAMLHPGRPATLRAALATTAAGYDAAALIDLDDDSIELAIVAERYADYGRLWARSGFVHAFEAWRRGEAVTPRLLALRDGERRITNWLHLADLLQHFAEGRVSSPSGLTGWLSAAIADPAARSRFGTDASLLRLETDDEAVSLLTLHRSKGLQFQVVYLPCLWEGWGDDAPSEGSAGRSDARHPPIRFHDPVSGRRSLDLGGPDYPAHAELARAEELAERLRLLYVGLTRARRQCVVVWGALGRSFAESPLAWLVRASAAGGGVEPDAAFVKSARALRDQEWQADWNAIADRAGDGAVSIEKLDLGSRARWVAPREVIRPLAAPPVRRPIPRALSTTSFSGLVRHVDRDLRRLAGPAVEGRDLDAGVESTEILPEEEGDLAAGMDDFPRGVEAGTLLHTVLEALRPWDLDEAAIEDVARDALDRNAVDQRYLDQVMHVVRSVVRTPLRRSPEPFRLADLEPGRLRPEMEFTLSALSSDASSGFTPGVLADRLSTARPDSPLALYAERARRLGWPALRGYLRGFIDAVFFDGRRYFLVDYKSNHLGRRQVDYRPERLVEPMIEHDYVLQYLLYSVALDRHLRCLLPDYRYEDHFGGVYYLFLRGMAESHEPDCGIFFDRPEEAIVREVSRLLDPGTEASA